MCVYDVLVVCLWGEACVREMDGLVYRLIELQDTIQLTVNGNTQ